MFAFLSPNMARRGKPKPAWLIRHDRVVRNVGMAKYL
jgi:hypothetical protein